MCAKIDCLVSQEVTDRRFYYHNTVASKTKKGEQVRPPLTIQELMLAVLKL